MSESKELALIEPKAPGEASLSRLNAFDNVGEAKTIKDGDTIYEVLTEHGYCRWDEDRKKYIRITPFVVQINGTWLLEKDGAWDYRVQHNDVIRIERLAGKGGGGGSKGIGMIVAIVAIVAAPFTGGQSLWLLVASGALLLAGPVGIPKSTPNANSGRDGASPTYGLQAQSNQARLLSAVPKLYGRLKFVPDLAAQPYTEFQGNDQYLYQLFALTCGRCSVKDIFVDDTPLRSFEGVEIQYVNPYQEVTLFPTNVVTSAAVDSIQLTNGVVAGPYVTAPAATLTTTIALDFTFPGGCYQIDDAGNIRNSEVTLSATVEPVNDQGQSIGPVVSLFNEQMSYATQTPQRISISRNVPAGRYRVTCSRSGADTAANKRIQNGVVWTALRSYLKDEDGVNYGNVTLLAVKMKSSDVLNAQTARRFSVLGVGMNPRWNSVLGWSDPIENSSIAWAAADILHNPDYGRGMATSRIDMAELERLDGLFTRRGDEFNGLFDTTISLWDALTKVCRAGRTAPIYYAGRVEFIRDEKQTIVAQMFSPRNMVAGSFSVQHNWPTRSTPDYIIAEYFDRETWTTKQVDCALPNSVKNKAATIEFFGITDRNHAWREGIFIAASNRVRRRTIRFSSEMEGQVIRYNDLIKVSHDVADWGFSGVVLSFNPETGVIRTSEPLPFLTSNCVIGFRRKNGSEHGPFSIKPDPEIEVDPDIYGGIVQGTAAQRRTIHISKGIRSDYTMYQFGPANRNGVKALVLKVIPRGDDLYNIEACNYSDAIHLVETGGTIPFPESGSNLVKPPVGPIIDRITVVETTTPGTQACQITPAVGAQYYEFQYRQTNGTWGVLLGATQRTAILINLDRGNQAVRARAYGTSVPGPWVTWAGEIQGSALGLPSLISLVARAALLSIVLQWEFEKDTKLIADFTSIFVSTSPIPSPASTRLLGEFPYPINSYIFNVGFPGTKLYFFAAVTDKSGRQGPFFNNLTAIEGETSSDPAALLSMLEGKISESMLTKELQSTITSMIEQGQTLATHIADLEQQYTTSTEAFAQTLQQLEAQVDENNSAVVQLINTTKANIDGTLSATVTMRAQVNSNGKLVTAGIGLGVTPDPDDPTQHNSELIFMARRVAFIGNNPDGPLVAPLVIDGPNVFMHGAFMVDATITNAKIGTAAVNTLKIAGRAVTIPYFRVRAESIPGGLLNGWEGNVPATTEFMIWCNVGIGWFGTGNEPGFNITLQLKVNGVVRRTLNPSGSGPGARPDFNMTLVHGETLQAGYNTVTLEGSITVTGGALAQFNNPSILLLGCMR